MYIANEANTYPCTGYYPTANDVRFAGVEGITLPVSGEIRLVSEDNNLILAIQDCGDYARQTFVDGVLTLTNEPEPAVPTGEELRAAAKERISGKCSEAIMSGVTVGEKHYSLSALDQISLNAAVALATAEGATIPYAADDEALTLYTAAQIKAISKAAYDWGVANRTYNGLLDFWRQCEGNAAKLQGMHYGSKLPAALMASLTADLTSAGIDAAAFVAALTA